MLGYLEQQPLYNSCNFSWANVMGPGWPINYTVTQLHGQHLLMSLG